MKKFELSLELILAKLINDKKIKESISSIKSLINTDGLGKDKDQFNASHDLRYYEQRGFNSANAKARANMGITEE